MVLNMPKPNPRERRHARTRQEILDAALQLVVKKGADKLSLREIARKVDYSPAGLYEYFGSKEEIIDALCIEGNQRLTNALLAISSDLPFADYLIAGGVAYVRFAKENPEFFALMFTRLQAVPDAFPISESMLHPDDSFTIVYKAIQKGIEEGVIEPQDHLGIMELAYSAWATAHGLAMLEIVYLRDVPFDFEKATRRALETLVNGMMS